MFRALIAAAALLSSFGVAQSADLPQRAPAPYRAPVVAVPVAYNWTGFYIGANGGYGWAAINLSDGDTSVDVGDFKGPFAGGQIGFNYQTGMFVFGIEVDGQWASIKQSFDDGTVKVDYFLTTRGRLGIAANNFLFYGTGGYAHAGLKASGAGFSSSGNRGGWTAGGGAEVGFGNASVKLEYLYLQTFDEDLGFGVTGNVHIHTVKLGLNYRFGGGPVVTRY